MGSTNQVCGEMLSSQYRTLCPHVRHSASTYTGTMHGILTIGVEKRDKTDDFCDSFKRIIDQAVNIWSFGVARGRDLVVPTPVVIAFHVITLSSLS